MPVFIPIRSEPEFKLKGLPQNIMAMMMSEKQIREILIKEDRNGDYCLSKVELKKAFEKFGSRMPAWRACDCLRKADINRDGQINIKGKEFDIVVDYVLAWLSEKIFK